MRYLLFEDKYLNELNYLKACWKYTGYVWWWKLYIVAKRFIEGMFYDDPLLKKRGS